MLGGADNFFPFPLWEGSHAIFKTATSRNMQCFFWGNMSSLLGFAKMIVASTLWLSLTRLGSRISAREAEYSVVRGAEYEVVEGQVLLRSHWKSGTLSAKRPSVKISQYYNTALRKGNYMEDIELTCSFVPTRDKSMRPPHPNCLMYCCWFGPYMDFSCYSSGEKSYYN